MKKLLSILCLGSLIAFTSCGSDNNKKPPGEVSSNSLSSNQAVTSQCGCTTEYKPVCGLNTNGNTQSYDNECVSKCFGASLSHLMRCEKDQSDSTQVCYYGLTKSETEVFPVPAELWSKLTYGACGQKQM